MLVLKWFLYVFTQWSELMRKHVNISLEPGQEVILGSLWHFPDHRATEGPTQGLKLGSEFQIIEAKKSRHATHKVYFCQHTSFFSHEI